ncbi:MAG: hypothetical protein H0T91_05375 [Propionibacteriaceae bacterium]|nr:hypothetical protein [Propionibacteriaceae bacterium]
MLWPVLTVATVAAAGLIPLLWEPRYYFLGDTQIAYFGQWFHLGEELRGGRWPLLDLQAWHGGNYVSEGQWGLFSPLTMGISLAATTVTNVVAFVTAIKLGLLLLAATGVFVLVRSYDAPPAAAYVAGVAVTLGGATQYLESPEWVTGQMGWALIPWAWWALRRTMNGNANPFAALVFGLLTVTVGYVYGTLYLVIVIVATLVDAWLARNLAGAIRVFLIGACCGLVAMTVYLPGLLTASVTTRAQFEILSEGRLQADVPGLLASMIPTVLSPAPLTPGLPPFPAHYIAWFLPMLAWLDLRRVRRLWRPTVGLIVVLVVGVLWALGPNQVGPLRWPIRVLPFITLATIVLTVVLASKAMLPRPTPLRLAVSLGWTAAGAYLIISRFWDQRWMTLTSMSAVMAGLIGVWILSQLAVDDRRGPRGRPEVVMAFIAVWSLGVAGLQHSFYPHPPTAVDRHMPSHIAGYSTQASTAKGDVMVVGDSDALVSSNPDAARDFLVANSWYVSTHAVQSVYSPIGFTAYNQRYCQQFNGVTCPEVLDTLFDRDPRTGAVRADLLSVSSLQIVRSAVSEPQVLNPPAGWSVTEQTPWAVTWVRDHPLPAAGGVVWSSPGLDVTSLTTRTREVQLRVNAVPAQGGVVVFSRLAWPGYTVEGGRLTDPTDGHLLTVELPATPSPQTVTVRFSPPGWSLELFTLWLGLGGGLLWSLGSAVFRGPLMRSRRANS